MKKDNETNLLDETAITYKEIDPDGIPEYLLEDPLAEADSAEWPYASPIPEWAL